MESSSGAVSRINRLLGNSGVRLSKCVLSLALSGSSLVHGLDFEQGEEAFLVLGRADLAGDQVAGLQVEAADLRRRDVNVLRAGQVIEAVRAQEAEAFGQNFQHAFGEQDAGALGVFLQDVENHLVLAHGAEVLDAQFAGHVVQLRHGHGLQLGDVHGAGGRALARLCPSEPCLWARLLRAAPCRLPASRPGRSGGCSSSTGGSATAVAVMADSGASTPAGASLFGLGALALAFFLGLGIGLIV